MVQVLPIKKTDRVAAMLPVDEYKEGAYLLMATVNGLIKKTPLSQFQDVRANGLIAMKLKVGPHAAMHHCHSCLPRTCLQECFLGCHA